MKFTDTKIKSLKPKTERYEAWEDNGKGFGIRISPTGRKTWIFVYRFDGKPRRMTLGTYPKVSLTTAHTKHATAREKLDRGEDPGLELQNKKLEDRRAPTIATLIDEYLDKWAKPRKKSWKEDQRLLKGPENPDRKAVDSVLDRWGKRKAKDITRRDIILLLDDIVDRGSPIAANRTFAVIRKMFNFAMSRDIIETTPCAAINAPSLENERHRILDEDEIKRFWETINHVKMTRGIQIALKLELITAQRKAEIIGAPKSEFDLERKWWTIAGERTKNKLPHRVPLSETAIQLLTEAFTLAEKQAKKQKKKDIWVFPSRTTDTHITEDAIDRALRRTFPELKIEPFTPHDLRRTGASQMASIGVPRLVIGKILNHAEPGVTAVYDRHGYDNEKVNAMEKWNRKLRSILKGKTNGKVVNLIR